LTKHLQAVPPAFQSRNPPVCVPRALEAIIFKCLAKQPEQRYPSMHELHGALLGLGREPGQPIPNVPVRSTTTPCPAQPSGAAAGSPGMTQVVAVAGAAPALGSSGLRARWVWLGASLLSIAIAVGWALSGPTRAHVSGPAAAAPSATPEAPTVLRAEVAPTRALPAQALPAEVAPTQALPAQALPAQALPAEVAPTQALHVAPFADLSEPAAPVRSSAAPTPPPLNAPPSSARPRRKPRSVTSAEQRPTPPAHGRQDLVNPWPER
jgi:hypothetical protein